MDEKYIKQMKNTNRIFISCIVMVLLASCSIQKKIAKEAKHDILNDSNFAAAHIGIALYDVAANKFVYNYQGEKYFIPASNTKIMTCYAAMKYLGDSLVGLRYVDKGNGTIEVEANGDPTFLHPDFKNQPVFAFLKSKQNILLTDNNWKEKGWGYGWAWDDYNSDYMAERSVMPVYGNTAPFNAEGKTVVRFFQKNVIGNNEQKSFNIKREIASNRFIVTASARKFTASDIPFYTAEKNLIANLLIDTLKTKVEQEHFKLDRLPDVVKIHSQPTDSLLKIMMHRSDNFFAEQSLLMISNERLGVMSNEKIIDTLLKTDYKDLPQKPKWVDGSGLSRYNLISPQDFVAVLGKMKSEFEWNRITTILPTGNEGTLAGLYKNYAGKIYAKTGTLSNNVALSGFITTNKRHQYIFSVMVNNHQASASSIRHAIENFIGSVIEKY
jgi:D-alanyl-D-alanine carboxypeptidase/D-alanyl-D-alanine-endopeptidase (penicillin-binding protein 4)